MKNIISRDSLLFYERKMLLKMVLDRKKAETIKKRAAFSDAALFILHL